MTENRFAKYATQQAPQAPAQNRFAKYKTVEPVDKGEPLSPKSNRELSMGDTAMDVLKSAGAGVVRGVTGLAGMPGDIGRLAIVGMGKINKDDPAEIERLQQNFPIPGSADVTDAVERNVTGPLHKSRSTAGDYAGTIGEFVPAVAAGPGGLVRKGAQAVIPAIASETAGKMTEGTAAEPYARAITAIATGAPLAGSKRATTNKILRDASKTSKAMQQAKNDAYKLAEDTVGKQSMDPREFSQIVRGLNKEATAKGIGGALSETTDKLYSSSKSILSDMSKIHKDIVTGNRPPPTYNDLEKFRQTLNDVVEGSKDVAGKMSADGYLALKFIDKLDDAVGRTAFQEARNSYKTLRKTERIERAIATAETRSSSTDLAYKNEFKKIVRENLKRPIFSKSEMEAIKQVAGTGRLNNLLEGLGRGGFSSKGVTAGGVTTGLAGMIAPAMGIDPITGMAISAAVTSGSKALGTRMTKTAAERARNIVSQGGDNAALDAKLMTAKTDRSVRRTAATANAGQQGSDGKRKPVRLKNGSIYWNPSPGEYQRLISSGEATAL